MPMARSQPGNRKSGKPKPKDDDVGYTIRNIVNPAVRRAQQSSIVASTSVKRHVKLTRTLSNPVPSNTPEPESASATLQHDCADGDAQVPLLATEKPRRLQTMSTLMAPFLPYDGEFIDSIMAHHEAPGVGEPCICGEGTKTTRCRDCTFTDVTCDSCFVRSHRQNPFHWAEKWNGSFFAKLDISQVGGCINLGHDGDRCPSNKISSSKTPKHSKKTLKDYSTISMTIAHTNGIHSTQVVFCACRGFIERVPQLLQARLYPSSTEYPSVAFSFDVLDDFDVHNVTSKVSIYDYCKIMRKRTSDSPLMSVADVYDNMRRVMRLWRSKRARIYAGQVHGIDKLITHRQPGNVAVICPTCPEPGFNVPHNLADIVNEHNKHIYTAFHAVDGNFHLNRKKKVDDPDDCDLICNGYFPDTDEYREYLKSVASDVERSTCANFAVMKPSAPHKFASFAQTGVIAVKCRHDLYIVVVDMEGCGERFVIADYALAKALRRLKHHLYIVISYDVACQYRKKIVARFKKQFPHLVDTIERAVFFVPKMHIQNHVEECMIRYSLNFTDGAGRFDGENPESGWAEANNAGPSTRQMNFGHRHETLSTMFSDSNRVKIANLPSVLSKGLREARMMVTKKTKIFTDHSRKLEPDTLVQWEAMSTKPYCEDGEWKSVYKFSTTQLPSRAKLLKNLIQRGIDPEDRVDFSRARAETLFINMGLKILSRRHNLKTKVKLLHNADGDCTAEEIETERSQLRLSIDNWRREQLRLAPLLGEVISDVLATCEVEDEELFLPSHFSSNQRSKYHIDRLAAKEAELRLGEAYDALQNLRRTLRAMSYAIGDKVENSHTQEQHTRSIVAIKRVHAEKAEYASAYCGTRAALISLGVDVDKLGLRPLLDQDMHVKRIDVMHTLGDGAITESWIWGIGRNSNISDKHISEWDIEAVRVQWFRAKADLRRWQEEEEIVVEEIRRTYTSFSRQARVWRRLAQKAVKPGYPAFAFQQAAIYDAMALDMQSKYTAEGGELLVEIVPDGDNL